MIASQLPLTHTPSCKGASELKASWRVAVARDLEINRRRTSPTAMGLRPPFFLRHASRVARKDGGRCLACSEKIHKLRQRGENLTCSISR